MNTNDFTEAARAEAEEYAWDRNAGTTHEDSLDRDAFASGYEYGAVWARDHLAAQEPTAAEVVAAARALAHWDGASGWGTPAWDGDITEEAYIYGARKALSAARTAVPQLLDQLDAAEQRIRDLTREVRDERAACLDQIEQVRVRDARIEAWEQQYAQVLDYWIKVGETAVARIKAVEDVLDDAPDDEDLASLSAHYSAGYELALQDIRRALDGDA